MTPQEREQQIRERCAAATPGPWLTPAQTGDPNEVEVIDHEGCQVWPWRSTDDMVFAYAARSDVPYLLARVKQLEAALAFYADEDNYEWADHGWAEPTTLVGDDNGERAGTALATMPDTKEGE